ncbi:MAG: hypothetical protein ACI4SG_07205 [Oligosphaeraceae bacterium]
MEGMTPIVILLVGAGVNLLVLGAVALALAARVYLRRLRVVLQTKELPEEWRRRASLLHPWREVALGLCISLSIPFFVHFCLAGTASRNAAVLAGYVSALLCALGCFSRLRHEWEELGGAGDGSSLLLPLGFFSAGLVLLLWGALSLALAVATLVLPPQG